MRSSMYRANSSLLAVSACLAALLLTATPVAASAWKSPKVVFQGNNQEAVAYDVSGRYHAAIALTTISGRYGLEYVESGRRQWVFHKGQTIPFVPELAIAYSPTYVRIVWVDTQHRNAIWISRNDTGSWVSSRLWLGRAHDPQVAALGSGIAVVFRDASDRLRYLTWDPVGGPSAAVIVASHCCHGYSLQTNAGTPTIALSTTDDVTKVETQTGPDWASTTLCASCSNPSLAYRGEVPVVLYRSNGDAWYIYRNGASWSAPVLVFRGNRHRNEAIYQPEIVTNASGDIAATAVRTTSRPRVEPHSDVLFRSIRPWGSVETAYSFLDILVDPFLTISGGRTTILFNEPCACAGGMSGGEFRTSRH